MTMLKRKKTGRHLLSAMVSKASAQKFKKYSYFSLLFLSFFLLLIFTHCLHQQQGLIHPQKHPIKRLELLDFLSREFKGKPINISLVNMDGNEEEEEGGDHSIKWHDLGRATTVRFDRVSRAVRWKDLFPEWIDEHEQNQIPKCPTIPMPGLDDYGEVDVVVARAPCGGRGEEKRGIRDVFRLQVHLVVANLVVRNGWRDDRTVVVVFVGSCGPMWEIFRCEDLVERLGDVWIYKPDLRRLKQKLLMPVGSCQLALPIIKHGQGKIEHDVSKLQLQNPWNHPREAYVTVLHSSEAYVCGAIALAQSIIRTNSTKDRVLLADKSISKRSLQALKMAGWKIKFIERIRSPNAERHAYNEWNYSKLRIWQLKEYDKVMFIDSDLLVLQNLDRFFALPQLSAVGNDGVLFNSGLMVIEPSECTFKVLMEKSKHMVSYNGGDQGYLNEMFTWWHRLPATANWLKVFPRANIRELHELPNVYAIHYLGYKPWMCYRDYDCNWDAMDHQIFANDVAHWRWWALYDSISTRLHPYCALSTKMELRMKKARARAGNARFSDDHWRIKVKDQRKRQ